MSRKSFEEVQLKHTRQWAPAMLNRRRFALKKILNRYMGLPFTQQQLAVCCDDVLEAGLEEALALTLKELLPRARTKKQQAELVPIEVRGVAVALDEEMCFNNYRYLSLQSPVYKLPLLPKLDHYVQYCRQHMEQQEEGFPGAVSKALRNRALQDFMQDMLPVVHHLPIMRLSVYDRFSDGDETKTLGTILEEDNERFYLAIADRVMKQLNIIDDIF